MLECALCGQASTGVQRGPYGKGVCLSCLGPVLAGIGSAGNALVTQYDQLRRRAAMALARTRMSEAVIGTLEFDQVLEVILQAAVDAAACDRGTLFLRGEDPGDLMVRAPALLEGAAISGGRGIAGHVLDTGKARIARYDSEDPTFFLLPDHRRHPVELLSVPLRSAPDEVIGVVNLFDRRDAVPFSSEDLQWVDELAGHAAEAVVRARQYRLAVLDGLTGVHVRRYFDAWLNTEVERAQRRGHDLSVVMLDIDHLKGINDRYSASIGDRVLLEFGRLLKNGLRPADLKARYGGEEFIVGVPALPIQQVVELVEKFMLQVALHEVKAATGGVFFTISAGVCSLLESRPERWIDLVRFADRALNVAKSTGRNRCVVHRPSIT